MYPNENDDGDHDDGDDEDVRVQFRRIRGNLGII